MKFSITALTTLAISMVVSGAPVAKPDGTLGGVVDAIAPITAGLGTTLNGILGFKDKSLASYKKMKFFAITLAAIALSAIAYGEPVANPQGPPASNPGVSAPGKGGANIAPAPNGGIAAPIPNGGPAAPAPNAGTPGQPPNGGN
ncbi:hypothetical protein EV178_001277 [Coemansia sp. RSA 1646]|nr:hypothetical protein EV178_001277 [Coemansia sp. RSA 1646]KAJ2090232.1 hypothetical protein IW138_002864 [Coemansia sp. RSA 986]KAJ2214636.1 hypothetical protein EV179_002895 [Coemansia sp. RSA 487]